MGVKNFVKKIGAEAGNKVSMLSKLSPSQILDVQLKREEYLLEMPKADDEVARSITEKMMSASSIEVFNAYLSQIKELYLPMEEDNEYDEDFDLDFNIRYFNITKWVTDKKENNLEKLVNVYAVLSNEDCNIALIFNRTQKITNVYLAVVNLKNSKSKVDADIYRDRLKDAISGNFPGAEFKKDGIGIVPCLSEDKNYSIATVSNIPAEKSEKFVSQTIEKLLDGIIPDTSKKEYTIVLLATPILDVDDRKLRLGEFYSGLKPYSEWQQDFHYNDSVSHGSSATVGVNVGASAGVQNGQSSGQTVSDSQTDQTSQTQGENQSNSISDGVSSSKNENFSHSDTISQNNTTTKGKTNSVGGSVGASVGGSVVIGLNAGKSFSTSVSKTLGKAATDTITKGLTNTISKTVSKTTGTSVANTLGKAVTNSLAKASTISQSANLGINFGANFSRASTVTANIGKNEGIIQTFTNYNIKHALELLENQMKRLEQSTALGMWDFAAYVLSEDHNVANNVAHSYLALTLGEDSYMSKSAINLWRGNVLEEKDSAREICNYVRKLRHPIFALNPHICIDNQEEIKEILGEENCDVGLDTKGDKSFLAYPPIITPTTSLSGKELAYSLNFPKKSISGLPVLECAEFGRNVVTYKEKDNNAPNFRLGNIFHMNHQEKNEVNLFKQSLASHTLITGSTGSGKSNTVYKIINEARKMNTKFLVIEPAKGEYKNIFGSEKDVYVYGTNPKLTPLLKLNPFSFSNNIHILEHLDRLVEIFNVCWPMYAAMPVVLKNALEKAYIDCGWDLNSSTNKYNEIIYPTFLDIANNVKYIIESSEYDNENKGAYKGALLTRLESLTNGINGMIFTQDEISEQKLFDENVIIDLSRVGARETKSLIMGLLILKLQEYRMSCENSMNLELKHLTVLEEAHNILVRTSIEQNSDSSNLVGKSVEMLSNAIAEMRTYGEGFIIVDQAPGLLDMSTIRNTNTKIIMRLPDLSDRELVGKSASLNDDQIIELAKLPCGVAAVYQNEWVQPVLCKVDRCESPQIPYSYSFVEEIIFNNTEDKNLKENLLYCIMNKEIFKKDDKNEISKFKNRVIKSKLTATIKSKFIDYLNSDQENIMSTLSAFVYEFFSVEKIMNEAIKLNKVEDIIDFLIQSLNPSIKEYSEKQVRMLIYLIMQEQMERNILYRELLISCVDYYKEKGGII